MKGRLKRCRSACLSDECRTVFFITWAHNKNMQDGEWQANIKIQVLDHMFIRWDQSVGGHYFHLLLEQKNEIHTFADGLTIHNLLSCVWAVLSWRTQDEHHYQEPGLMLNSKQRAYLGSFIGGLVNKETGMTSKDKRLVYLVEMRHCRLSAKNGWSGNLKSHVGHRRQPEWGISRANKRIR